jgi:monoamine oxidase
MELALQRGRQAGQIKALEEAERLQQALFQIADLAGADLEMSRCCATCTACWAR